MIICLIDYNLKYGIKIAIFKNHDFKEVPNGEPHHLPKERILEGRQHYNSRVAIGYLFQYCLKFKHMPFFFKPLIFLVPKAGLEPARNRVPRDFKSLASANSATPAYGGSLKNQRLTKCHRVS
jgi:hypothetical protein